MRSPQANDLRGKCVPVKFVCDLHRLVANKVNLDRNLLEYYLEFADERSESFGLENG